MLEEKWNNLEAMEESAVADSISALEVSMQDSPNSYASENRLEVSQGQSNDSSY